MSNRRLLPVCRIARGAPASFSRHVVSSGLLLLAAACSTPPPVRLHTLLPAAAGVTEAARAGAEPAIVVALEPIRVPAQFDQSQWLVRLPDDTLASLEQERWASPLRDELQAALLERLAVRFGIVDARSARPGTASGAWRVGVDIRRFESRPGRAARIEGSWTLASSDVRGPALRCEFAFEETSPGAIGELAAAHRRAVIRLADAIGAAATRMARRESASCPTPDAAA